MDNRTTIKEIRLMLMIRLFIRLLSTILQELLNVFSVSSITKKIVLEKGSFQVLYLESVSEHVLFSLK